MTTPQNGRYLSHLIYPHLLRYIAIPGMDGALRQGETFSVRAKVQLAVCVIANRWIMECCTSPVAD
jgi:hypothetical protein